MGHLPSNAVYFPRRRRRRWSKRAPARSDDGWFLPLLVGIPLTAFMGSLLWSGTAPALPIKQLAAPDSERASFPLCGRYERSTCVVDGDTLWYRGEKIRIADINTPETSETRCAREAALGRKATLRLQALLNQGPFTLEANPEGRALDKYGRRLLVVTRNGESLGGELVREGLAEYWCGYRGNWC